MRNSISYWLLLALCLFSLPMRSQLVDAVVDKAIDVAVEEIPSILLSESDLNAPGGAVDTSMDWTAIWRSSDVDSTGGRYHRYGANDWETRPKGKRTGCICMDGTEDDSKGRGACSGHGGVRYWKHELSDGKEMHHATTRHFRHPDPLTKDEKLVLAANNEEEDDKPGHNPFGSKNMLDSFVNLAIIIASSTIVIYYIRQMAPKEKPKRRRRQKKGTPASTDDDQHPADEEA